MLQKKFRLPASIHLFHPQIVHTPYFIVKMADNAVSENRFGFIVGKKIDKRAVLRNKLKRRFRANLEKLQHELVGSHDFLFLLKTEATEQSTEFLAKQISDIFLKKGLVKRENRV